MFQKIVVLDKNIRGSKILGVAIRNWERQETGTLSCCVAKCLLNTVSHCANEVFYFVIKFPNLFLLCHKHCPVKL
jgi:hypothetical protein